MPQTTDNKPALIGSLSVASRAAGASGQWEFAAWLAGTATALRTKLGLTLSPAEDASRQQHIATIRSALGESAFTAAEAAGQALSPAQAVEQTLRFGDRLG